MSAQTDVKYAGFWRRFIAIHIDLFVVFTLQLCLYAAITAVDASLIQAFAGVLHLSYLVIYWLYFAGMESSSYQGTLGKVLVGVIVTDTDGNRVSFLRATGRNVGKIASSIIFGLGYLLAAFTKKKQALHDMPAQCLVIRERDTSLVKLFLIAILFIFLMFSMLFGFVGLVMFAEIQKVLPGLFGGGAVTMNGQQGSSITFEPNMDMGEFMPQDPQQEQLKADSISASERNLSLQQYEQLIAAGAPALDPSGPTVTAGPAMLEVTTFFTDLFWLEVAMPEIPNFSDGMADAVVKITEVTNKSGANKYDPNHNFQSDLFTRLSFSKRDTPVPHMKAIRQVNHMQGLDENNLATVKGTLMLSLPVNIQSARLAVGEEGNEKQVAGSTVSLKSIKGSDVNISYKGIGEHYLGMSGFNAAGQELESSSHSILSDKGEVNTSLFFQFQGEPVSVEVIVASDLVEKSYPFEVKR